MCPNVSIILLMRKIFCTNVPSSSLNVPAISTNWELSVIMCKLPFQCVSYLYPECKLSVLASQLFVPICVTHLYLCVIHQLIYASHLQQMASCLYQSLSSVKAICIHMCQPSLPMCNLAVPILYVSCLF